MQRFQRWLCLEREPDYIRISNPFNENVFFYSVTRIPVHQNQFGPGVQIEQNEHGLLVGLTVEKIIKNGQVTHIINHGGQGHVINIGGQNSGPVLPLGT